MPNLTVCADEPDQPVVVARLQPQRCAAAAAATKSPPASAVQNAWSDAVCSGTQDRNVSGLTPITLTGWPPAVISAPSKVIMFRTPVILRSLAICRGRQALRGDDQQVGQDDLAEGAAGRGRSVP